MGALDDAGSAAACLGDAAGGVGLARRLDPLGGAPLRREGAQDGITSFDWDGWLATKRAVVRREVAAIAGDQAPRNIDLSDALRSLGHRVVTS